MLINRNSIWTRVLINIVSFNLIVSNLVLPGVIVATMTSSAPAQAASTPGVSLDSGKCLQDAANTAPYALGGLSCNSNDIGVANATNVSLVSSTCQADGSGNLTFNADFKLVSTATSRYNVGVYFAVDGDPNGDGALTGTCSVSGLPSSLELDHPADACGDISKSKPITETISLSVPCSKIPSTGLLPLPYCTAWHNSNGSTCNGTADLVPENSSKCNCQSGSAFSIQLPGDIQVFKSTYAGDSTSFPFTVTGPSAYNKTVSGVANSGVSADFNSLPPGTYHLAENVPAGWRLVGATCGDGTTNFPQNSDGSFDVVVKAGKIVNCLFTDDDRAPAIGLTKSASPQTYDRVGQTITYTYTIKNTGTSNLGPAQFSVSDDKINAGVPFTCGGLSSLTPDSTLSCTNTYNITQADLDAGSVTNNAVANGAGLSAGANATVTAVQNKALQLAKSASPTTYSGAGQTITYTYTVKNTGNTTLGPSQFTVSDDKIANGAAFNCGAPTSIAPNATMTCTNVYTTTQADVDAGSVTNTAIASGGGVSASASAQATVTASQSKSLGITKSASPQTYNTLGQTITYTYTVKNTGNTSLGPTQFKVSDDKINAGAAFNCGSSTTKLTPGATVVCTNTYSITQADLDGGSVTNTATASGAGVGPSSPAHATVTAVQNKALSIAKSASTPTFNAVGQQITYTYTVKNTGNVTVGPTQFSVSDDKINAGIAFLCNLPSTTLAPNATISCTNTYNIMQQDIDAGFVTNNATASGGGVGPSAPASVTITALQNKTLAIGKSASPLTYNAVGQTITYTYTVRNAGNTTLASSQFTVSDNKINSGAAFNCGGVSTIAPNATVTCTNTYAISQADLDAGSVTNTATASGGGASTSAPAQATVTAVANKALSITKSASPLSYSAVGDVITYTYTVKNSGNVTLNSAQISVSDDKINNGAAFNCGAPSNLAPNSTITCTNTYSISQADLDAGSVTNHASASGGGAPASVPASATVTAIANKALSIAKSASPLSYSAVGDVITYTYTVKNSGNVTLNSAQISVSDDKINNGAAFNCGAPSNLAPNATINCTNTYSISQADLDAGSVTNHATASGGGAPASAPASATVTAIANRQVSVAKAASPLTYAAVGQAITYTYTIKNIGNVTLGTAQFTVSDNKINGGAAFNCGAPAKIAPNATLTCTHDYSITQADLDAGSVTNTATASGGGAGPSSPASATVTAVQTKGLVLIKGASPLVYNTVGQTITYHYTVVNNGNITMGPVQFMVSDDKINGGALFNCGGVTSLAPQASLTCDNVYTISQADLDAGSVTNTATATDGSVTSPEAHATVTALQEPALGLSKSSSTPSYSAVGDSLVYSYVLTNTGNVTLDGPYSVSDDKAPVTCPDAPANLLPGESVTCFATYSISQADLDVGHVTNVASAQANHNLQPVVSNTDSVTVSAVQSPLLSLTKTDTLNPGKYDHVGQVVGFVLTATNNGNVTLNNVTVSDDPALSDFACVPALPVANLAPGASVVCGGTHTITQADLDAGSYVDVASARSNQAQAPDASDTITAQQNKQLSLTKSDNLNPAHYDHVGQVVTFTLTATNTGNFTLNNVNVSDAPALDAYNCTPSLPVATLAPGTRVVCTGTHTITQTDLDAGSVLDTASATSDDANAADAPDTITAKQDKQLSLTKTDDLNPAHYDHVGQVVTFTITAKNSGNFTLSNINVTDDPALDGFACVPALPVSTLSPGAAVVCTGTHTITQDDIDVGSYKDTASASSGEAQAPDASDTITARQNKLLTLSKTDDLNPAKFDHVGQVVTFTITATNSGNFTLHDINVTDAPVLDGYSCTPALPVATLAPGASVVCKGTHTTNQAELDAGIFTDVASATSAEVNAADATDSIYALDLPHLKITKIALESSYDAVGNVIHYNITATNDGNITLPSATVTDALVGDLSCSPSNGAGLAPLASLNCTATHTITQADIDAGSLVNAACVDGSPALQACTQVGVNAIQNKSMSITKTDDLNPGTYDQVGQVVNYTITAVNTGNYTLHNVNVSDDPVPENFSCNPSSPVATLAPGAKVVCTGSHTITQDDLTNGSVTDVATARSDDTAPVSAQDSVKVGLGTLTLLNEVVIDNGGTAAPTDWQVSATGQTSLTGQGTVSGQVIDGAYTLSENGPSAYTLAITCKDAGGSEVLVNGNVVNVPVGANITCVLHNDDIGPQLHLVTVVSNTHRRTATADQWTLTATGMGMPHLINGAPPVDPFIPVSVVGSTPVNSDATLKADTYTLAESGPDGYTLAALQCVDANNNSVPLANGNQVTLNLGDNVTCVFAFQDNIIPNLIVDPGCNCDSTGSMNSTNMLNMALLLALSLFLRRRLRVKAKKD